MFKITMSDGSTKDVKIDLFPALTGWEIQNRFVEFAASSDPYFRREFTMEVLSYAKVMAGKVEIPLKTDALIDNHLQGWQNVKAVFEEVLSQNGIDAATHADKSHYWEDVGAKIAVSFVAEASRLMAPAMKMFDKIMEEK